MPRKRARIALTFIFLMLVIAASAIGQANFKVVEVAVEGNRVASNSLILGVSSIHLGSPLSPAATTETIQRLYGLGIFSDVTIDAEEVAGGLKVYIVVKELPKLMDLTLEGNKKFDSRDIKEDLNLGVGGYISPYLISQKMTEIKDMYANKGYFQATVTFEQTYNTDSTESNLKFIIVERSKVKVANVIMTGNDQLDSRLVIKKMRNRKRGFLKTSDFAQDKFDEDRERIVEEFHKRGFIDAYLISDSMSIDTATNKMTIYLEVYEGPKYYFGEASFELVKELPADYLHEKLKFTAGDVFNLEKYEESLSEIYTAYYDIGHLHIQLLDERTTRSDTIIDINYRINEGLPSHINLVHIVGNNKTKDRVIRRELKFFPGQRFTRSSLVRSVRDAMALNYFTNINPVPIDLPSGDVDIELQVDEKQTGEFSAGAGYNSQDKVVGNVGMGIPNFRGMGQRVSFSTEFGSRRSSFQISFTEPWLFGKPTLLGADIYSTKRRWFDDYTESRQGATIKFGRRLRWPDNYFRVIMSYRLERDRYEDFDAAFRTDNSFKVANVHTAINSDGVILKDTTKVDVGGVETDVITDRQTIAYDLKEPFPGSILAWENRWNTASRIAFTIIRDSRNLPEFATSGSDISYSFEKTGGFMGGYWNYTKHHISVAKFVPLFWNFALAARVQFGAISTPANSNDTLILLSDRFTPGGTAYDGIVRGYDDGSLTPDEQINLSDTTNTFSDSAYIFSVLYDPAEPNQFEASRADTTTVLDRTYTSRIRGNFMLVANVEIQFPIISRQIYGLFFFDAGNSWRTLDDMDWGLNKPFLYAGTGAGLRVVVPGIGTIGIDFAYPLDEFGAPKNSNYQEKKWRTHFQIGTTFR